MPSPPRDALEAVAREVTGDPAAVRQVWTETRARFPQLRTRSDVVDDFLVDALAEIIEAGLPEIFLFLLDSRGLTSGEKFKTAAAALTIRAPLGNRLVTEADDDEERDDLLAMRIGAALPPALPPLPTILPARFQTYL